ncbi:MAG TPA: archaellar assembly protein FlaJ [Thermoplasmata archaeon]|nr:archaellar assembly protein FlaJ [Thermoplasmata archaeon]
MDLRKAYINFRIPPRDYLLRFVLPAIAGALVGIGLLVSTYPDMSPILIALISGIPVVITLYVALYPAIVWQRRGRAIDEEMHLFITRMGVITSQEIPRMSFVELLKEMEEYEDMGREVGKIFHLVRTWRLNLSAAAKQVSEQTPSPVLADFLRRFAFAIEGGESESEFFAHEQDAVLDEYEIRYEGVLRDMDIIKEIFIAMITASMFIIAIVAFIPILTGKSVTTLMALGIFLFTVIEGGFLYIVSSSMPLERVWQRTGIKNAAERHIERALVASLGVMTLLIALLVGLAMTDLGVALGFLDYRSWPFLVALAITPLAAPGYVAIVEEERIRRREDNFPAFIRTLGSTAEAKSIAAVTALRKLTRHDFGPLTRNIVSLSRRLSTSIDARISWRHFGAETGSDLIAKFSDMYVEGFRAGGRSRTTATLISRNFVRILGLRKKRYQSAAEMTGVLFGIMVAISFAMYTTVEVLDRVQRMYQEIQQPIPMESVRVLNYAFFSETLMAGIILSLVVSHAFISALMLRIMGGGHKAGALIHFVGLVWVAAIVSVIVARMMDFLMPGI